MRIFIELLSGAWSVITFFVSIIMFLLYPKFMLAAVLIGASWGLIVAIKKPPKKP